MRELTTDRPEVPACVEVRRQWPAQALVELSQSAGLVVVGRHAAHGWLAGHLGSMPRTVLRKARCPVMVVPVNADEQCQDDGGWLADGVSPQA